MPDQGFTSFLSGDAMADGLHATLHLSAVCLLTLHRLDKVLDSVGSDTEGRTLLHELRWDMVVGIQVVHCLRVKLHRVHELTREGRGVTTGSEAGWAGPMPST